MSNPDRAGLEERLRELFVGKYHHQPDRSIIETLVTAAAIGDELGYARGIGDAMAAIETRLAGAPLWVKYAVDAIRAAANRNTEGE